MSDIKVIDGLEVDEVIVRHVSNGDPVARYRSLQERWIECPNLLSLLRAIADGANIGVIDTTTPEVPWSEFKWDFFNQYGGLLVKVSGGGTGFKANSMAHATLSVSETELRESPFYYWPGGEQPVPDGIEIRVVTRDGEEEIMCADECQWGHIFNEHDIIAFKITGRVL